jgi:hypothetical protein
MHGPWSTFLLPESENVVVCSHFAITNANTPIKRWSSAHFQVLVASYRETKCPRTLVNLFTKAKHPERIRIGIIQQNKDEV